MSLALCSWSPPGHLLVSDLIRPPVLHPLSRLSLALLCPPHAWSPRALAFAISQPRRPFPPLQHVRPSFLEGQLLMCLIFILLDKHGRGSFRSETLLVSVPLSLLVQVDLCSPLMPSALPGEHGVGPALKPCFWPLQGSMGLGIFTLHGLRTLPFLSPRPRGFGLLRLTTLWAFHSPRSQSTPSTRTWKPGSRVALPEAVVSSTPLHSSGFTLVLACWEFLD